MQVVQQHLQLEPTMLREMAAQGLFQLRDFFRKLLRASCANTCGSSSPRAKCSEMSRPETP
jgi:hypothetical protein